MLRGEDRWGLLILLLGLVVQMACLIQFRHDNPFATHLVLDAWRYDAMARDLLEHGFRVGEPFHQAPLYPYGVSLLYAILGERPDMVMIIQAVVGALVPFLLYRVGRRFFGVNAGLAAAALGLLYGPLVAFAPRLLPTVPVIALQLLLLDRLPDSGDTRLRRWILPGVLLGLLCVARPNFLLIVVWILGMGIRAHRRGTTGRPLWVVAAIALVMVAPVTLHNLSHGGGLVVVAANGGETFYHGNNPRAAGTYSLMAGLESADILRQEAVSRELAEREVGHPLNAAGVSRFWFRKGLSFIGENPGRYAWLELQKLRLMLGAEESPVIYSPRLEAHRYTPLYRVAFLSLPLILPLALAGLVLTGRRLSPWLVGLLITQAATLLLFYVSNRYRLPLESLLLLPAGLALARIRERRTWVWVGAGIVLSVLLALTADPNRTRQSEAIVLANLGASMGRSGETREAEAAFRETIDLWPQWARGHHYLGRTLVIQGRPDEAIDPFQRAVALEPGNPEVELDLAAALATVGRAAEAREHLDHLERAGRLDTSGTVRAARMWMGLGDPARAGVLLDRVIARGDAPMSVWPVLARARLATGDCPGAGAAIDQLAAAASAPTASPRSREVLAALRLEWRATCGEGS